MLSARHSWTNVAGGELKKIGQRIKVRQSLYSSELRPQGYQCSYVQLLKLMIPPTIRPVAQRWSALHVPGSIHSLATVSFYISEQLPRPPGLVLGFGPQLKGIQVCCRLYSLGDAEVIAISRQEYLSFLELEWTRTREPVSRYAHLH